MGMIFLIMFLSLNVFPFNNCDVANKTNDNSDIDGHINKTFEDNATNYLNSDSLAQSHNQHKENISIGDVAINSSMLHPELPSMTDNSSSVQSNESPVSTFTDDKPHPDIVESPNKLTDQVPTEESTSTSTDDIPTFVEYQQMIEKETKQKREKSDSTPSIPTMVIKDVIDASASHQTGEHIDPSIQASVKIQEVKEDTEHGHTPTKSDDSKLQITTSILSKSLMKNNVAAKECGAKILEISGHITNAVFVLNNNKDEYLNVPCSINEKWFIFETCEPVQIRSIQIANFEMFSSRPKTFKVTTADRYPVKHWYNLGVFRAHDEKGIQTFEISDARMVKYIKFEMVDHYGSEHYCPLTFVRVMGNVVIDDMDEEPDDDQPAIGEKHVSPKEVSSATDSDGLLTKAKEMIVKIVNGIGGSNKEVNSEANKTEMESSENIPSEDESSVESPCYFFEFVSKNYRNYFYDIWHHFQRFVTLRKHIVYNTKTNLESAIVHQPFPLQIRAEYFTLFDLISKTNYSFYRLYLSFLNVSTQIPSVCVIRNSLRNLSCTYKCHFHHFPSPGQYQPYLPNITTYSAVPKLPTDASESTVLVPNVTIKIVEDDNPYIESSRGQYEPALSGNLDVTSTSNHPAAVDDSVVDDTLASSKNRVVEELPNFPQDNKSAQTVKEIKSDTTDNVGTESAKLSQTKLKSEDMFDSKIFASPGSNAWNYAFMRIKNIAKELEVNVSISMKYLEELSQNYKQQTDKLKKAQLVMASNVSRLENMINKHHEETSMYIKELKIQLQTIIIRMKFGLSPEIDKKRASNPLNLSTMEKHNSHECFDFLVDGLILPAPSWFESSVFLIGFNIVLSLVCNSILLAILYSKMKLSIMSDVSKIIMSSNNNNRLEPIEEIPCVYDQRRSLDDLRTRRTTYPVVLPPRGVRVSNFADVEYLSDNDNLPQRFKNLGSVFYPVQPNVKFVTPTKDRKKKKRK